MDWKFWIGDVAVPLITFVVGLLAGKTIEKRKYNKATVKGDHNAVIQGNHYLAKDE